MIKNELKKLNYEELLDLANAYISLFTPENWCRGKMKENGTAYICCSFNGTDFDLEIEEGEKEYKNADIILKWLERD